MSCRCFYKVSYLKRLFHCYWWALIIIFSCLSLIRTATAGQDNTAVSGSERVFTIYSTKIAPLIMPDMEQPGFLYELILEVTQRVSLLDQQFLSASDVVLQPWNRAFKTVEHSTDKLLLPMTRLPERENKFVWIMPVMELQYAFLSTTTPVNSLDDARSLERVAVYRNTSHEMFLKEHGFTNLSPSKGALNAHMLEKGRVDAWYSSVPEALWLWKMDAHKGPLIIGDIIHSAPMWLVASKDFPEVLIPVFREALADIREDGTYSRIYNRYFQVSDTGAAP